jgi:hypothetical protein
MADATPNRFTRKLNSESCRKSCRRIAGERGRTIGCPSHWQPERTLNASSSSRRGRAGRDARPLTTLVPDAASPAPPRASALHSGRPIVPTPRPASVGSSPLVRPVAGIPRRRRRSRRDAIVPCERGRTRHAVVLAADCAKVDLGPCSAAPGVCRRPVGRWPRATCKRASISTSTIGEPSFPTPMRCVTATTSRSPVRSRSASRRRGTRCLRSRHRSVFGAGGLLAS